jgi:G2/mitotic-specific cyclin-B, other
VAQRGVVAKASRTTTNKASYAEDMALDSRASDMHEQQVVDDEDDVLIDVALEPSSQLQLQQRQQQQQQQQQQQALLVPAGQFEDIDVYDEDDAQCVTEYIVEIFAYLRQKELAERVDANYMLRQSDLTPKMRAILVDWMVDVHLKFKLLSETMFLSVSIIDRYLALKPVSRHKLQLVGITAMLIAAKYEELYSPEVRDFVYICDMAFCKEDILALEIQILNALNFSLTPATPLHFLRRFSKAARSDSTTHTLSKFLVELTLPEYEMLVFKPSTVAAAAVYMARAMRQLTPYWTPTLEYYTQHSVRDLRECATQLNAALIRTNTSSLKATRRKYSSPKLLSVGRIPALPSLPF